MTKQHIHNEQNIPLDWARVQNNQRGILTAKGNSLGLSYLNDYSYPNMLRALAGRIDSLCEIREHMLKEISELKSNYDYMAFYVLCTDEESAEPTHCMGYMALPKQRVNVGGNEYRLTSYYNAPGYMLYDALSNEISHNDPSLRARYIFLSTLRFPYWHEIYAPRSVYGNNRVVKVT